MDDQPPNPRRKEFFSRDTQTGIFRAFLRALPVLPGPELFDIFDAARRSRQTMEAKIENARLAMMEASSLVADLEETLKERSDHLARLKQDVERYSQLATVEEEKARALLGQLEISLTRGQGRERWISLAINLIAGVLIFVLGIILGPILSRWLIKR